MCLTYLSTTTTVPPKMAREIALFAHLPAVLRNGSGCCRAAAADSRAPFG